MAIAFIGSVFSPYYWRARQRGDGDPLDHCAVNVALYGAGARWAMTERSASSLQREGGRLVIGPSSLTWNGRALVVDVRETCAPLPRGIVGRIVLTPLATNADGFPLDPRGRHRWRPWAPCARADVEFERPRLRWSGHAYLDSNEGDEPLEAGFSGWNWSRALLGDGSTAVIYDVLPHHAPGAVIARRFTPAGKCEWLEAPPVCALPATGWHIPRTARSDSGRAASVARTLEDTPFYARSVVHAHWHGQPVRAVHESLSLDRFSSAWVRALLPWRMPRG